MNFVTHDPASEVTKKQCRENITTLLNSLAVVVSGLRPPKLLHDPR